mgnify:CR=1 FL=1
MDKIIIVEGTADKKVLKRILREDVEIICTYGTFGIEKFDEMLEEYDLDHREVYIFVDSDDSGIQLRKRLKIELPNAYHMYIPETYREVERTPEKILAQILGQNHFNVNPIYLML